MIRSLHKVCGPNKGLFLEPYACSLQVFCNCCNVGLKENPQNLPKLPVPKLNDTLQKYLKTVRPHLSNDELLVTTSVVQDFENTEGKKLQCLLEKRFDERINWLKEWWLNIAYLEYRNPVVVWSSPGLVFPIRKFTTEIEQLQYAAQTLLAAVDYKILIDNDKISLEKMGKNLLDMDQYKKIFGTCRVPCEKRDRISYNDSKHVTVMHNNHIFRLDLWGSDGILLREDQIIEQLVKIKELSQLPTKCSIGILTTENRDTWAKAYASLSAGNLNTQPLSDIENSLFVLCLDRPVSLWSSYNKDDRQSLAAQQTIHGGGSAMNGGNRWFDKTVQFIVGADGVTGLTYEHSPAEGQPIAVLTDFIINYIDQNKSGSVKTKSKCPIPPKILKFNVSPQVESMIVKAGNNLDNLVNDLEVNCFTYYKYGKNFIKSQKLSPDSYLQMAMQYAFYRLHKTPGAHYESAATRMFAGGRTETIRSCSIESVAFASAMMNANCSPKIKLEAMRKAINAHKDYTVQALQGLGVDRHFLGLKMTAIENNIAIPKLYTDPGFVKSSHFRLSTSQVACKADGFMCYGPLVNDGYATCYNPRDDDINFGTSAFISNSETSCVQYRAALEQSLQDMHDLLMYNTPSKL